VKHLLSIHDLPPSEILNLIESSDKFLEFSRRSIKKAPTLRGKTVINLFLEPSTRTRTSFELAGKRLSADVINVSAAASSTKKGESLKDTVLTLDVMQADVIVVRHASSGSAQFVAQHVKASVINAGDGAHVRPRFPLGRLSRARQDADQRAAGDRRGGRGRPLRAPGHAPG